jgi:hypothetical protein
MDYKLNIAKEFSLNPGPRYIHEGLFSAEKLQKDIFNDRFEKAIASDGKLIVNLDGVGGYGTSFLEELFGGAVRNYNMKDVQERIEIISEQEPYLLDDISEYIKDALNENRK